MRGFRRPVGDQPASVYWRRRVTLGVAVVVVAAIGWLIATALTSEADDATAAPEATSGPASSPATTPTAVYSTPASAGESPSASPEVAPASVTVAACDAAELSLAMDSEPTITDDAVTFAVVATHTAAGPCLLDGSGAGTELVVTSGDTRIWSSADCEAEPLGAQWLLDGPVEQRFDVTWPREWSEPGCGEVGAGAPASGYYWAGLVVQDIAAEAVQFVLP